MSFAELLSELTCRGFQLKAEGDVLSVFPSDSLTQDLRRAIKAHKPSLLALLVPQRDPSLDGCPCYWKDIPELPPRKARAVPGTAEQPERYRVRLFGMWYLIRFEPTISEEQVSITCAGSKRRMFASLSEFYRWAWAEHHIAELGFLT